MRRIINTVKSSLEKGKLFYYHIEQNKVAKKFQKIIEKQKGTLDPKHIQLCKEYAKDIFGDEKYAPWLLVYCAQSREFKEGWIPDNYYGEVILPNLNGAYGKICNRTAIISKLIEESDSLNICYYINHLFLDLNSKVINEASLKKALFAQCKKIVFKLEESRQGKGIYFYDEESFDLNIIKRLGNGVFQNYIEQHPFFTDFVKSSVATIRLTSTCDNNGSIEVKAGYLRVGREDETHVKSASAMKIAIDINNGQLSEDAYFPNWASTKFLPNNDIIFAGKVIPSFHNCIAEVKRMHNNIPLVRCIGWDIIVDNTNNLKVIELNGGHNSITFSEMTQGPCFKGLNWESLKKQPHHH